MKNTPDTRTRLRIAVQKSGRLNEKSMALLEKCGITFDTKSVKDRLLYECEDFPIDLLLVRDDDIPEYVADGVCDLGFVGENVIEERIGPERVSSIRTVRKLGFGKCRLSIALREGESFTGLKDLHGKRIASAYPQKLGRVLKENGVQASIVELSGSVEIAPALNIADAICDLVSTGGTLRSNGLKEVYTLFESQAVLIRVGSTLDAKREKDIERLLQRLEGVQSAQQSKYIMMNAPRSALDRIREVIPGMENPSILTLGGTDDKIAIHAVSRENIFWDTIEKLKQIGASSILVLPIEKIIA